MTRRALLGLAVALAALVARQLHAGGAPLLGVPGPLLYLPAAAAGVALAGWAALGGWRRAPLGAAALAFAAFLANDRVLASGDTHGAALLPYNVLRRGTLALDGLVAPPLPYWAVERGGRVWSRYPVVAPLLALPVYLPAAAGEGRPGALPQAEKLAAALVAACSVGFVLAALARLGAPRWLALAGTALYALGSPVLSTASQALWQHGPGALALAAALWAALRAREDGRFHLAAGLACGLAVAARPTNAFAAGALLLLSAEGGARALLRAVAGAALPVALAAAYQAHAFGSPLATGYGAEASAFSTPLAAGLAGVVLSPTHGLLPFVPWAAASAVGFALGARRDRRYLLLATGVAATVLLYARWHAWWGGWCYGPRFLTDAMPLLAAGLAPLAALPRRRVAAALAALGALAVLVQGVGTFASRSPAAQAVYGVRDGAEAMEAWRWPPLRLLAAAPRRN